MILRGGGLIFDIWGENEKFNSKRQVCSSTLMVLTHKTKNPFFLIQRSNVENLNNLSLKYPRLAPTGYKYIGLRKFECDKDI